MKKFVVGIFLAFLVLSFLLIKIFVVDTKPKPSFPKKLQIFLKEMTENHEQGFLQGDFIVAKGDKVLLRLRSDDVDEMAKTYEEDPQFMIASVSKQFFAVALLKILYDKFAEGESEVEKTKDVKRLLHLPVSHFLPKDNPLWDGDMPYWADEITLHHLLSHTCGLPNYTELDEFNYSRNEEGKRLLEIPHTMKEVLKIIAKYPLDCIPGTKCLYCNTGYNMLSEVIRELAGMSPTSYLTKTLFNPLGLTSTFNPERGNEKQLRESDPNFERLVPQKGYDLTGNQDLLFVPPSISDISWAQGDGSLVSTVSDLLKWNLALHKEKTVLPPSLYELFITANSREYAYGIYRKERPVGLVLWHPGQLDYYKSDLYYLADHDISIVILSHIAPYKPPIIEEEEKQLLQELKDKIPSRKERISTVSKILNKKYPDTRKTFSWYEIADSLIEEKE